MMRQAFPFLAAQTVRFGEQRKRVVVALLLLLCFGAGLAGAQNSGGCSHEHVVASPTRPTFSTPADVTQCGNVEMDYGWTRSWPGAGVHSDDLGSSVRFGLTPFLDLHWSFDNFVAVSDGTDSRSSSGDHWFGARANFHRQTRRTPSLGLMYSAKAPAASVALGFGSGYVDHSFAFLASRDLGKYHLDFNAVAGMSGKGRGFDHSQTFSLACTRPLARRFSGIAELYGGPQAEGHGFGSAMAALTYQVNPRLVLDSGVGFGATQYAPRKRLVLGMTYAVADIYSHFRSNQAVGKP